MVKAVNQLKKVMRYPKLIKEDGTVYHATSSLVPIIDLEVGPRGSFGNRFGFSFEAPTDSDPYPTDLSLASTLKCFIYRLKMFQRPADSSTAQIIYNSYSANSSDFVLKPHAADPSTNQQVSLHSVIVGNYQEERRRRYNWYSSTVPKCVYL